MAKHFENVCYNSITDISSLTTMWIQNVGDKIIAYPEYHMVSLYVHKCQGQSVILHGHVADDDDLQ